MHFHSDTSLMEDLWLLALAGVAQWIECWPVNQKGLRFNSQSRARAWVVGQVLCRGCSRGNHTLMFLSLSLTKNKRIYGF